MRLDQIESLDWDKQDGLLPAIVQDTATQRVLMLGYMNREALLQTLASRQVTFFSRSRKRLWIKGESSGHHLELVSLEADCDADSLLVQARPLGPTCHLGRESCFIHATGTPKGIGFLVELDALIAKREQERPEASYTTRLFTAGIRRIAQKLGEEAVETTLAAACEDEDKLIDESADLVFHLMVLLRARGQSLATVAARLAGRNR